MATSMWVNRAGSGMANSVRFHCTTTMGTKQTRSRLRLTQSAGAVVPTRESGHQEK